MKYVADCSGPATSAEAESDRGSHQVILSSFMRIGKPMQSASVVMVLKRLLFAAARASIGC